MTFVAEVPNTYNPAKEYIVGFWLSTPKLNGVRCIYTRDGAARGLRSQSLTTRYVGLDRLELACRAICDANNLSFIDGELFIPGKTFNELTVLVRDRTTYELDEKFAVQFRVSAVGSATNLNLTAQEMVNFMQQIIPSQGMICLIPQKQIRNTPLGVLDEANAVMNSGGTEGIILRNLDSVYSGVRSDNLLKVKGITSGIFTVVGFTQNPIVGYVSYMSVEGTVNGVMKTSRVYGLNDEEEQDLWMNRDSYIGKQVQIVYMGLTATGNLRSPALGRFV
ncbi:hypothetical protein [Microcoleus asticus]|uniref:DNA ligase n=1 Tax=Microcoleus asticus IPMA8 TaxID=2563858 RepID=A0ABX2D3Q9_9CYAN|nr:hypothetical protein [Microcoleus asticus]NQE37289.1 hypothetical protein [Microcoleus asticus IPMA8]